MPVTRHKVKEDVPDIFRVHLSEGLKRKMCDRYETLQNVLGSEEMGMALAWL